MKTPKRKNEDTKKAKLSSPATTAPPPPIPKMSTVVLIYAVIPLLFLGIFGAYNRHNIQPSTAEKLGVSKGSKKSKPKATGNDGVSESGNKIDYVKEAKKARAKKDPRNNAQQQRVQMFDNYLTKLRENYNDDPDDIFQVLNLAEGLRQRDITIHDGGSTREEGIQMFQKGLSLAYAERDRLLAEGEATNIPAGSDEPVLDENILEYPQKSIDGIICAAHSGLSKTYFMADMFQKAVEEEQKCLTLRPTELDSLSHQASTYIILGQFEKAAANYLRVLKEDKHKMYADVYVGLPKVLVAKESAVEGGWDALIKAIDEDLPVQTAKAKVPEIANNPNAKNFLFDRLKKMHLAMFSYHDNKTKDTKKAWKHLSDAYHYKMSVLDKWPKGLESRRVDMLKSIFHEGFWPPRVGSRARTPIFVIGFVRTGSTLMERVLDAHSQIVGTGEDSVFNGRLDKIRDGIVEASMGSSGQPGDENLVGATVDQLARGVVEEMKSRWEKTVRTDRGDDNDDAKPLRFVDKMLLNYMNVGFIHMLFPKALILHVIRNPMDTLFSAYKHDFPPGTLDYTSEFESLAELYIAYRDIMEHWDEVLPGRVTHVRYEDFVRETPALSKAIIKATGLKWEEDVLQFHKKNIAVNTLSTSQVRRGIYNDHLEAWRRYEDELQPLVKLLGDRVEYNKKTTLVWDRQTTVAEADMK